MQLSDNVEAFKLSNEANLSEGNHKSSKHLLTTNREKEDEPHYMSNIKRG